MNKLDVVGPQTVTLSNVPGYNVSDQYLTQIATFTFWVDTTDGAVNLILPAVSLFKLNTGNFRIFDIGGNSGNGNPIVISFADGALVNGADSVTLDTNYGNVQVQLQDGEWFANLNGTGGGGGGSITGANSGLSVFSGDIIRLGSTTGSPLLQNSIVTGLQTFPLAFQSTDGSFFVAAGNLSGAPYGLAVNSFAVSSTTASTQLLSLALTQNGGITLENIDSVSSATRVISIISTSAGSAIFPTGGVLLGNSNTDKYSENIILRDKELNLWVINGLLSAGFGNVSQLTLTDEILFGIKYIDNTNPSSLVNGWSIGNTPSVSALYWGCAQGATGGKAGGDLTTGLVLQLASGGVQFLSTNVPQFSVSSTGIITVNSATMPTSDPHSAGQLFRTGLALQMSNG